MNIFSPIIVVNFN